jgi:hypothetical protein
MDNRFYTYVLINSLDNMPIYVGKGKKYHWKLIDEQKNIKLKEM